MNTTRCSAKRIRLPTYYCSCAAVAFLIFNLCFSTFIARITSRLFPPREKNYRNTLKRQHTPVNPILHAVIFFTRHALTTHTEGLFYYCCLTIKSFI